MLDPAYFAFFQLIGNAFLLSPFVSVPGVTLTIQVYSCYLDQRCRRSIRGKLPVLVPLPCPLFS